MESSQKLNLINDKFENPNSNIELLNGDIYNDNLVITNELLIKNDNNNEKRSLKKDIEASGKMSSRNKQKFKKNYDIFSLNESFSELSLSDKRKIKKIKKVKEERYIVDNIDNILSVLKEPKLKLVIQEYVLYTILFLISIYYWIFLFLTTVRFEQAYCYTSDNQFDSCTDDDICDDLNIVLFNHTFNYHNHQLNSLYKLLGEENNIINTYYKPFFLRYNYLLIKNKTFSNYDLTSITDKINFGIMISNKEKWNLFLRFFSYCQYESYYFLLLIMIGVGGLIGSLVFGLLSDIYGRRAIIRIILFIITISTLGIFIISFFLDCYYKYILKIFNTQYIITKENPSYNNILSHLYAQNKVKEKFNKLFIFLLLFTFLLNLGLWPLSKSCISLLVENTKSDLYALINFRKIIFAFEGLPPFLSSIIFSNLNDFTATFFVLSICNLLIFIYSLVFLEESIRYYYEYCEWENLTTTILNTYNNEINDFKTLNKFELKKFKRKENLKHFNLNNNLRKRKFLNKEKKINKNYIYIITYYNDMKEKNLAFNRNIKRNTDFIIKLNDVKTNPSLLITCLFSNRTFKESKILIFILLVLLYLVLDLCKKELLEPPYYSIIDLYIDFNCNYLFNSVLFFNLIINLISNFFYYAFYRIQCFKTIIFFSLLIIIINLSVYHIISIDESDVKIYLNQYNMTMLKNYYRDRRSLFLLALIFISYFALNGVIFYIYLLILKISKTIYRCTFFSVHSISLIISMLISESIYYNMEDYFLFLAVTIFICLLTLSFLSDFKELLFLMNDLKIDINRPSKNSINDKDKND